MLLFRGTDRKEEAGEGQEGTEDAAREGVQGEQNTAARGGEVTWKGGGWERESTSVMYVFCQSTHVS